MAAPLTKHFGVLRLDTVRSKILVFAVLVTLIPSGSTAWISYSQNRRALEQKISKELLSSSAQAAREMDVWLKERLYDLRVFASSYEVTERLAGRKRRAATDRLDDYLNSVRERFGEYEELVVLDLAARVVATSGAEKTTIRLPAGWAKELITSSALVGPASWDPDLEKGTLVVAVPVQRGEGKMVGVLAARLNLRGAEKGLRAFAPRDGQVYLLTLTGTLIASSAESSAELMRSKIKPLELNRLKTREGLIVSYEGPGGSEVLGSFKRIPRAKWAVLSEIPADAAYAQIRDFRNVTLMAVSALLFGVGLIAYRLGVLIVRPLERLTKGAAEVAEGDLAVDLPAAKGEVGDLTAVFNHMVGRLRQGRQELDAMNEKLRRQNEELERLSTSDALTGLYNRRYLTQRLSEELVRSYRHKAAFSVLMADVDEFKKYNDAFGHPAGDEVLKKVAAILLNCTRSMDCTARYGGEEFAVLLTGTPGDVANEVAERIRARVEAQEFAGRRITLSIGIAEFPTDGQTADEVISSADEALYSAKRSGRNRVVRAGSKKANVRGKI
ncbi:MAG TPA: diguanylate cyclase [Gemmatimonadales bacterium]|nr:diguanylate cyclase [Gemmatimonadales bacterium]